MASIVSAVPNTLGAVPQISQCGPAASMTGLISIALPGAPMDSDPAKLTLEFDAASQVLVAQAQEGGGRVA